MDVTSIIKLLILCVTLIIVVLLIMVDRYSKMINDKAVGYFIVNTTNIDEEIFRLEFNKSPNEFINQNYIVLEVKKE